MVSKARLVPWSLVPFLFLAACASQSPYHPRAGGYGYSEIRQAEGQYEVVFRARGDDVERAQDYAMLRASELTLQQGYDWFQVVRRDSLVNRKSVPMAVNRTIPYGYDGYRVCSPIACHTYIRPHHVFSATMVLGNERSTVEVRLRINMGKGMRPENLETYDAREMYSRLNPQPSSS